MAQQNAQRDFVAAMQRAADAQEAMRREEEAKKIRDKERTGKLGGATPEGVPIPALATFSATALMATGGRRDVLEQISIARQQLEEIRKMREEAAEAERWKKINQASDAAFGP